MLTEEDKTTLNLTSLGVFKIWEKLRSGLNFDLTPIQNQLTSIESKIDQLQLNRAGITFIPIIINPTYQLNSVNGWSVTPIDLQNITDGNLSTGTNQFELGGTANTWGEIIINLGINVTTIYTRVSLRLGIASNNPPNYPALTVEIFNNNNWTGVWCFFGQVVNNSNAADLIQEVNTIVPSFSQIKIRLWDLGRYATRCIIYDLKVWSVN